MMMMMDDSPLSSSSSSGPGPAAATSGTAAGTVEDEDEGCSNVGPKMQEYLYMALNLLNNLSIVDNNYFYISVSDRTLLIFQLTSTLKLIERNGALFNVDHHGRGGGIPPAEDEEEDSSVTLIDSLPPAFTPEHQRKRRNLGSLLGWICSLSQNFRKGDNFDVLKGLSPFEDYGLEISTSDPQRWKKHLVFLLEKEHFFRFKQIKAIYTRLFGESQRYWSIVLAELKSGTQRFRLEWERRPQSQVGDNDYENEGDPLGQQPLYGDMRFINGPEDVRLECRKQLEELLTCLTVLPLDIEEGSVDPLQGGTPEDYGLDTEPSYIWKYQLAWLILMRPEFVNRNGDFFRKLFTNDESSVVFDWSEFCCRHRNENPDMYLKTEPHYSGIKYIDDIDEVIEDDKRENLRGLMDWIVTIPTEYKFGENFDVLQGHNPSYYGLNPLKRGKYFIWKKQLLWLLMNSSNFQNGKTKFVHSLFGTAGPETRRHWEMQLELFRKKLRTRGSLVATKRKRVKGEEPTLQEKKQRIESVLSWVDVIANHYVEGQTFFRPDFDVLRNQKPSYYGLSGKKTQRQWKIELCKFILKRRSDLRSSFFNGIFGVNDPFDYLGKAKEELKSEAQQGIPEEEEEVEEEEEHIKTEVMDEDIDFNFGSVFLEESPEVPEYFRQSFTGTLNVGIDKRSYSRVQVLHFKTYIKHFLQKNPYSLIAISANEDKTGFKGTNLVGDKNISPDVQAQKIVRLLKKTFGFTMGEIYKAFNKNRKERIKNRAKEVKEDYHFEKMLTTKSKEELTELLEKEKQALEFYLDRTPNVTLIDLRDHCESLEVEMVEELDPQEINYVGIMHGHSKSDLKLRTLITQDCLEKYRNEEVHFGTQNYTQATFVSMFIRIMCVLHCVEDKDDLEIKMPNFVRDCEEYLALQRRYKLVLASLESEIIQCTYCGKVFDTKMNFTEKSKVLIHIRDCRLEQTSCGCGITFKSLQDKKRHMAFNHSKQTYISCDQCDFFCLRQPTLDNHITRTHGRPGEEQICSICGNKSRSPYYLKIHMFTHEEHKCEFCGKEIVGRMAFRNHKKNAHGAGFDCNICGKTIDSEWRLERHIKIRHKQIKYN